MGVDFGRYINADILAKDHNLIGEAGSKKAQELADAEREDSLNRRIDFSFETVMSHESKPQFIRRAFDAGFNVTLYFVGTGDPQININRVRSRVAQGGHYVPEDRIINRYHRSIDLLPQAMISAHRSIVFDNSSNGNQASPTSLRPVVECFFSGDELKLRLYAPIPRWIVFNLRLSQVGFDCQRIESVGLDFQMVYKTSKLKDYDKSKNRNIVTIHRLLELIRAFENGEEIKHVFNWK